VTKNSLAWRDFATMNVIYYSWAARRSHAPRSRDCSTWSSKPAIYNVYIRRAATSRVGRLALPHRYLAAGLAQMFTVCAKTRFRHFL